jgi:hypothetical protein
MEENKTEYHPIINRIMMMVSITVVLVFIPLIFINGNIFEKILLSAGIETSPNINDGYTIAEFFDPSGDLLLPLPHDSVYQDSRSALDIRKFSIKKVEFNSLSGIGIDARLNVCFEFDGKQPNPYEFKTNFSFPVIHVYLKNPDSKISRSTSGKTANVNFNGEAWNYQVIIDGAHEQARVFDNDGIFLFNGLGLYLNYEYEKGHNGKHDYTTKTRITAGLPLKLIGDPSQGEWKYFVMVGLLDIKELSMLYRPNKDSSNVFDYAAPDTSSRFQTDSSGRISLQPLIVHYSQSQKKS